MPAVRLLVAAVKVDILVAELKNFSIHIAGIQETKWINWVWHLRSWLVTVNTSYSPQHKSENGPLKKYNYDSTLYITSALQMFEEVFKA